MVVSGNQAKIAAVNLNGRLGNEAVQWIVENFEGANVRVRRVDWFGLGFGRPSPILGSRSVRETVRRGPCHRLGSPKQNVAHFQRSEALHFSYLHTPGGGRGHPLGQIVQQCRSHSRRTVFG